MGSPALPALVKGPAIVIHNGQSYYARDGIKKAFKRTTWDLVTDAHGKIDERLKSQVTEISLRPTGQIGNLDKYFPFTVNDIGNSIFKAANDSLVIHTKAGQTITYPRAAITKMPTLKMGTGDTLFGGDMTLTCIGKEATQPTAADYWHTIAAAAFADATFDEALHVSDIYKAAWGLAPFNAMGSMDGFEFEIAMETEMVEVDGIGIADIDLKSLTATCKFAPSNLTEANIDTLLSLQGADAVLPGQSISKGNKDLIISSDIFTATLHQAGPKDADYVYQVGKQRFQGIMFTSRRTFNGGAANPLWTFTIN